MTAGLASAVGLALSNSPAFGQKYKPADTNPLPANDRTRGLKLSVASYTFRQKPLEPTIAGIKTVGISYVSIKDFHLPLKSTPEQRKEVAEKFKKAGITPLSCGVISLPSKPATLRQAFEYARDAGIPTIVGSPAVEALPEVDALVKEFDIKVAIHNHGPEDMKKWPTPHEVWEGIQKFDPRIGLCIDVGHTARAYADPADCIRKYHERLYDVHLKDENAADPKGKPVEVGRGVLDIRGILQALVDVKYQHLVSFEYEKDGPEPLPGLAESVGYVRGILAGINVA
jgi:sugar phosphate isomerase/epimerase